MDTSPLGQPPAIRSGQRIPYFKPGQDRPSPLSSADMNVLVAAINALLACPQIRISERNLQIEIPPASNPIVIEQWQPQAWGKNSIVFFTPDGAPSATYYAVTDVPATDPNTGLPIPPDTGAPYWGKFPTGSTGFWL